MKTLVSDVAAPARDPVLLAAIAVALALRVGLVLLVPDVEPVKDEVDYWLTAEVLSEGRGFRSNWRPPLYPAFMVAVMAAFDGALTVRLAQALLGSGCVALVYLIALRAGGTGAARAAALLVAVDPVLIGFSHLLWSETVFIALLLAGVFFLLRNGGVPRPAWWGAAGLCFGLAALTRAQILTFLPLLLPWAWLQARRRGPGQLRPALRAFALLTLGTCAVVAPWTIRNARVFGAFVVVDTNGAYNLLVGTEPSAFRVDKDDHWNNRWAAIGNMHYAVAVNIDPAEVQRRALDRVWGRILHRPGRFLQKSLWEASHLFTLDNFVLRHVRNGWYGGRPAPVVTAALTLLCAGFTALLLGAGCAGLVAQPASAFRGFTALALVHATLLFGLSYSLSRYAVPLRPLLAVAAGWLLAHPGSARERLWSGGGGHRRAVLCAAIALWLSVSWWRDVPLLTDMITTGGTHFTFRQDDVP